MNAADIVELLAYNDWANDRVLGSAASLSDEKWTEHLGGSFPTLLDTLTHLVGAEWFWLRRWKGVTPKGPPEFVSAPSPRSVSAAAAELKKDRADFVESLSDSDLAETRAFTLRSGLSGAQPLGSLILHVVNHSTYHRGQVAAMLRRLGAEVPATDLLVFNGAR